MNRISEKTNDTNTGCIKAWYVKSRQVDSERFSGAAKKFKKNIYVLMPDPWSTVVGVIGASLKAPSSVEMDFIGVETTTAPAPSGFKSEPSLAQKELTEAIRGVKRIQENLKNIEKRSSRYDGEMEKLRSDIEKRLSVFEDWLPGN